MLMIVLLAVVVLWSVRPLTPVQADAYGVSTPVGTRVFLPAVQAVPPTATPTPTNTPVADNSEVLIPAGPFQMGCDSGNDSCAYYEQPLHTVTLSAYSIDKYEVTNHRYKACVDAGGCTAPEADFSMTRNPYYNTTTYAYYPVIIVDWNQAATFCAWDGKRLPTEAEWEKAARGNKDTRIFPWGNSAPDCTKANIYISDTCFWVGDTSAVGAYPKGASPYGVMDMTGNTAEWVSDWWQADYYSMSPASNPTGPATGTYRVLRGGAWDNVAREARLAGRSNHDPGSGFLEGGFRCVRPQ
jgi:formylglycine-generating enzyme required for sulfatase activity